MRKERVDRFRKAMKYQRMAFLSLFPEPVEGHLEVIGGEVRKMMTEMAADVIRDCMESDLVRDLFQCVGKEETAMDEGKKDAQPRVKKVNIQ